MQVAMGGLHEQIEKPLSLLPMHRRRQTPNRTRKEKNAALLKDQEGIYFRSYGIQQEVKLTNTS